MHLLRFRLPGEHCFTGGHGWWKYELCYRTHAKQVHMEGKERQEILLGTWNDEYHKGLAAYFEVIVSRLMIRRGLLAAMPVTFQP